MLYIFGGLPAVGKTSLSTFLAARLGAVYVRVDTIEQALKDNGITSLYDEGYKVAFRIAVENLKLGLSVVADSTNPIDVSREAWRQVANEASSQYKEIEVICSDAKLHQKRVENRQSDIENLILPSWDSVTSRQYDKWKSSPLVIDTAGKSLEQSQSELLSILALSDS